MVIRRKAKPHLGKLIKIHVICDASEGAYGTSVGRVGKEGGRIVTDSMVVLTWLKDTAFHLNTYEENRISQML